MRFIVRQFRGWGFRDFLVNAFVSLIIMFLIVGFIKFIEGVS